MYFIKDINKLVENDHKDLQDFIDPISLKDGSDLMKSILKKLFELRDSNSGIEKTVINILIKDWLAYIYFGCVSKIYKKKSEKDLNFYNFKSITPNINFFNNYKPSNFRSLKRTIYRSIKQFMDNKNIIVKNLDHNSIIDLNKKKETFTNINSSYIENFLNNKRKVFFFHYSDIFKEFKYYHKIEECNFTRKVKTFINKNFNMIKNYEENLYSYFYFSIKYTKFYFSYLMSNSDLIPNTLLVHNQKNIMDRIIINAMKLKKGKVVFFDHGGGSYYYKSVHNVAWSVKGNFYLLNDVDEFVTYSSDIGNHYKNIIPKNMNLKISSYNKKYNFEQNNYSENEVLILDFCIDNGRLRVPPWISEITRIKLMIKLVKFLKEKKFKIHLKCHPDLKKETSLPDVIIDKYKIKKIDDNFENLKTVPRNIIFPYPATTLLYKTMLMNYNLIYLDLGFEYQEECEKLFNERMNIIKCKITSKSVDFDEKKLIYCLTNIKTSNKCIDSLFNKVI